MPGRLTPKQLLRQPERFGQVTLNPLTRSPLADQAARTLREQVASGHWPVGTRLPGENELARRLGVGR
ncbi:GntR family transcriptional regulator, partial [Streptosporangium algeriense]